MKKIFLCTALIAACAALSPAQTLPSWQSDTLSPGMYYHNFNGMEPVTGAPEIVCVAEVDLDNPAYKVAFQYDGNNTAVSKVFKESGALATINATYEKESVYIKVDGKVYWAIDSPTIPGTPVPQWKSDSSIALDSDGKVHIDYVGRDGDKTVAEMRKEYIAMDYPCIFTSSPMLIYDFEPVGKTFAERGYTEEEIATLNYESPLRHQHARHPRSAVALTKDNHLLLIAVDGRRPGIAEGMNACELTSFLEHYFHPQYALNLDGGGSTTLCVKGFGDPEKNVVNYPSGNRSLSREQERPVITKISILPAE